MYLSENLISKELNRFFPNFEFNNKYKKELAERTLFYVLSKIKEKRNKLSLENYEKFLISFLFSSKRKEEELETLYFIEDNFFGENLNEFFLIFNPLHYKSIKVNDNDLENIFLWFLIKERFKSLKIDHMFYFEAVCDMNSEEFYKKDFLNEGSKKSNIIKEKLKLLTDEEKISLVSKYKPLIKFNIERLLGNFELKEPNVSFAYLFPKMFQQELSQIKKFDLFINGEKKEMLDLEKLFCPIEDLLELKFISEVVVPREIENNDSFMEFQNKEFQLKFVVNADMVKNIKIKQEIFIIFNNIKKIYSRNLDDIRYCLEFYNSLEERILKH